MIGRILGYDLFDSHTELSVDRKLPQITKISYCLHLSFPYVHTFFIFYWKIG